MRSARRRARARWGGGVNLDQVAARYAADVAQIADYLRGRGLSGEDAQYARLGYVAEPAAGHEMYAGRLSIPYLTADGAVRDIRFRRLTDDSDAPKYLSLPGTRPRLFEARVLAYAPDIVVVCEGELDTLVARRELKCAAVGIPGVSAWKGARHWRTLLAGVGAVVVLADGDEAGRGLARSIAEELDNVRVVPMPPGLDVTDVVIDGGGERLRDLVSL